MSLLEVVGLYKSFGGLAAVKDISLSVPKSKIVSLIGPNGAGKTTVFNLLTGFYEKDQGLIELDGEELTGIRPHEYINKGLSRTFQNLRLFSKMTVLENVMVGYQISISYNNFDAAFRTKRNKEQEKKARERAREVLGEMGLEAYENDICSNLPYGQQKRLEIARALVSRPKVLLLDEPAAGLNPNETIELSSFIHDLSEAGNTIFLIEHDMRLVMEVSDYIYVMDHGVMISQGPPNKVQQDEQVIEAYFGKGAKLRATRS